MFAGVVAAVLLTGCGASGARELSGDLAVHDPAYAVSDGTQYVYSTGNASVADGGIQIRVCEDDRGRLAPELHREPLQERCGVAEDQLPGRAFARE